MVRVVYFRGRKLGRQQFRFRLVAGNGRILCVSEAYTNRDDCLSAGRLITGASTFEEKYDPGW